MTSGAEDEADKSHDATPQKLLKAREKGEVARSADLSVAAGYAGWVIAALVFGAASIREFGTALMVLLDQSDQLSTLIFSGSAKNTIAGVLTTTAKALVPWYIVPSAAILLSIFAQRGFVVAPSKIQPKSSRVSIISNAKNKFGRSGLFEFSKSFVKLLIYSITLGFFLRAKISTMIAVSGTSSGAAVLLLARLCIEFLLVVLLIASAIGVIDAIWQHKEHLRKNRMSRKEVTDESKEAEGDPYMKQKRRSQGQEIAMNQMMADVPGADVVIVNPTHFAVALTWSKTKGSAPVCVAKGVDEIAMAIRKSANLAGVPIHHDPPSARAVYATVDIGQEIAQEHYQAVAVAIRFAENMRARSRKQV